MLLNVDSQQRRYVYFSKITVPPPITQARCRAVTRTSAKNNSGRGADGRRPTPNTAWENLNSPRPTGGRWFPTDEFLASGTELLGTDETWKTLSQLQPNQASRDRMLVIYMGPQYPWYWSAGVLIGLFGLSVCMLNFSVKSMDRLK